MIEFKNIQKRPFQDCTDEEKGALLLAVRNARRVEIFCIRSSQKWEDRMPGPALDDREIYRVPTKREAVFVSPEGAWYPGHIGEKQTRKYVPVEALHEAMDIIATGTFMQPKTGQINELRALCDE